MKAPFFILAGNGPYDNRGCEAIVRGTVAILRRHFERPRFLLCSQFRSQEHLERQQVNETDPDIRHVKMNRMPNFPNHRFLNRMLWRLYKLFPMARRTYIYREILGQVKDATAVLSIGGDNYGLDYNSLINFTDLDDLVESKNGKLIIWGASIGPFGEGSALERQMAEHLKRRTAIFSRESTTTAYLRSLGVHENLHQTADPAFATEVEEPPDAGDHKDLSACIGLNWSPLMAAYVCGGDLGSFRSLCVEVVRAVLEKFERPMLLVPHAMNPYDERRDDFVFLKSIHEIVNSPRVSLLAPTYNAAQTKWFISRCFVFAGARTHSTIAALSAGVPTLSFGYSFKADGLNRDLFGHLSYCIRPKDFSKENIISALERLIRDRESIRRLLGPNILRSVDAAYESGALLKKICISRGPEL